MKLATFQKPIFPTIQGDGVWLGLPMVFVRLWGCDYSCAFCFVEDTPILMADWSWKRLGDLEVGDWVAAQDRADDGSRTHMAIAQVTRLSSEFKPTVVVNERLRCTPDHKFWRIRKQDDRLAHEGWREVENLVGDRARFLATPPPFDHGSEYRRGYLAGMSDGDGCFWTLKKGGAEYRRYRLALRETDLLQVVQEFAALEGYELRSGTHVHTTSFKPGVMAALWLTKDAEAREFEWWLHGGPETREYVYGYLAGIFDAEGSLAEGGQLRISQDRAANPETYATIARFLRIAEFRFTEEAKGFYVSRDDGEAWRFFSWCQPRKVSSLTNLYGGTAAHSAPIVSVRPTGIDEKVITVTTTTGSFVAGGFVVKNCDTKDSWRAGSAYAEASVETIETEVRSHNIRHVAITGGNPLLQADELVDLLNRLGGDHEILVETQASIFDPRVFDRVDMASLSPKLHDWRWDPLNEILGTMRRRAMVGRGGTTQIKVVCTSPADVQATLANFERIDREWGGARGRPTYILLPEYGLGRAGVRQTHVLLTEWMGGIRANARPDVRIIPQIHKLALFVE